MIYFQVKEMMNLDFQLCENLTKVTICSNFPTSQSLPNWLKVSKISFNPKTSQYKDWFKLENASQLICIFDMENFEQMVRRDHLDFTFIERMKNLETIQFEISWNWLIDVDETELLLPLLTKLKSCKNIQSIILHLWTYPTGKTNFYKKQNNFRSVETRPSSNII